MRDQSKQDTKALDMLRRGRASSEDWRFVAGAMLRKMEALEAINAAVADRVKALEAMVVDDEPPEANTGGAVA